LEGVIRTRAGYAGGAKLNPTYHDLGDHSESLQVDFDPKRISFQELLELFWRAHDPTHRSLWTQYKTVLFFADPEQERAAVASRDRLEAVLGRPVRTEILPLAGTVFYQAEDYHQKYRLRHVRDLMDEFHAMYPAEADFIRSTAAARINGYLDGQGGMTQLERELDSLGLSAATAAGLREYVAKRS
jgi:peptide-methionine (S)-S-oxide reductase